LREVRRNLKKGWPPGLTVLTGDDLFHLDAAQRELLGHLVPEDASDFALTVYGEGKTDTGDLVAAARTSPMFSPCRVVLVRDVGVLEGSPEPLVAYGKEPPEQSYLIIRAAKLDLRRQLHKALADAGRLLTFALPAEGGGSEAVREVGELAAERGLKLDREATRFILEACAFDLYRVSSELDKLDAWIGSDGERTVRLERAQEVVSSGGALSGWEVANAILQRDTEAAVVALRRLVEGGDEPIRIVGGLAWRARTMIRAKAMLEAGEPRESVIHAARAWRQADSFLQGVARYSMEELLAFPARLLEADRCLKSRSLNPLAVLESLVYELTGPGAGAEEQLPVGKR
jgi:DNA polymerase-3 subunit delta